MTKVGEQSLSFSFSRSPLPLASLASLPSLRYPLGPPPFWSHNNQLVSACGIITLIISTEIWGQSSRDGLICEDCGIVRQGCISYPPGSYVIVRRGWLPYLVRPKLSFAEDDSRILGILPIVCLGCLSYPLEPKLSYTGDYCRTPGT